MQINSFCIKLDERLICYLKKYGASLFLFRSKAVKFWRRIPRLSGIFLDESAEPILCLTVELLMIVRLILVMLCVRSGRIPGN